MIRITIICMLISIIRSENCTLNSDDIKELKSAFAVAKEAMKNESVNEDAAICIGAAKSGKSTLINYLIGNKLMGKRLNPYDSIKIIKYNASTPGPEIGAGSTSKTKFPSKWTSKNLSDLPLWDSAGFEDNRGAVRDIINSFYTFQLTKQVKSLKFILIVNFGDIDGDNINEFISLLRILEKFFGSALENIFSSITVIFSKAPSYSEGYEINSEFIKQVLSQKLLSDNEMELSNVSKSFISYLINNPNHIAFFRKVTKEGIILNSEIDDNIFPAIENSTQVQKNDLQNIGLTISDKSMVCLYNSREKILELTKIDNLEHNLRNTFETKMQSLIELVNTGNKDTQNNVKNNLQEIEKIFYSSVNEDDDMFKIINTIKNIDTELNEIITKSKLIEKIEERQFVSKLLKNNVNYELEHSIKILRQFLHTTVRSAIQEVSLIIGLKTEAEYKENLRIIIEEQNRKVNKLQAEINKLTEEDNRSIWSKFATSIIAAFDQDKHPKFAG